MSEVTLELKPKSELDKQLLKRPQDRHLGSEDDVLGPIVLPNISVLEPTVTNTTEALPASMNHEDITDHDIYLVQMVVRVQAPADVRSNVAVNFLALDVTLNGAFNCLAVSPESGCQIGHHVRYVTLGGRLMVSSPPVPRSETLATMAVDPRMVLTSPGRPNCIAVLSFVSDLCCISACGIGRPEISLDFNWELQPGESRQQSVAIAFMGGLQIENVDLEVRASVVLQPYGVAISSTQGSCRFQGVPVATLDYGSD